MNVRDLTLVLRPRSGWESVDLGCKVAKMHYGRCLQISALFIPLMAAFFFIPWKGYYAFWLFVIIWWLKPLVSQLCLFFFSRAVFGEQVSFKAILKRLPQALFVTSWLQLTVRRLSFARSMHLPIHELEGLKGSAKSKRKAIIERVGGEVTFLVSLALWVVQLSMAFGLFSVIGMLTSGFMTSNQEDFTWDMLTIMEDDIANEIRIGAVMYLLTVLAIEPIQCAIGFCLYLNSRTTQEAWDVELEFRELGKRASILRPAGGAEK